MPTRSLWRRPVQQIQQDSLRPALKMLTRVARTQQQLVNAWEVLVTMIPADYSAFRDSLGQSSGFQSYQYCKLEFLLGNKNAALIEPHKGHPEHYQQLQQALHAPSLCDKGTGGTAGVSYLHKALALQFFPELWSVRTSI